MGDVNQSKQIRMQREVLHFNFTVSGVLGLALELSRYNPPITNNANLCWNGSRAEFVVLGNGLPKR